MTESGAVVVFREKISGGGAGQKMPKEPSRRRLEEIAAKHAPKGWALRAEGVHPDEGDGFKTLAYADFSECVIVHPHIVDRASLCVFLHECGHVHYRHDADTDHHVIELEWEAEKYAWEAVRAAGLSVPKKIIEGHRGYLRNIIEDVYGEGPAHDPGYDISDICEDEKILRFVYGKDWRNALTKKK